MVVGAYLKKVEEGPRPNRPQRHVQVIYFDAEILLNSWPSLLPPKRISSDSVRRESDEKVLL